MAKKSAKATIGQRHYRKLVDYAHKRRSELTVMFAPLIKVIDAYGAIVSEAVDILGRYPPETNQEVVSRDLLADVFDFLWEWQRTLMDGRPNVAFPLGRRAYESLSLMSVCMQDAMFAERWATGRQIGNADTRKALVSLPMGENEDNLRSFYKFFSEGAHPNRDLVARRYLGDGNAFVLGSIGQPNLILVTLHCIHLLDMWFWYGALVVHVSKERLVAHRPSIGAEYLTVADEAKYIGSWLAREYDRLLAEYRSDGDAKEE